MVEQISSLLKQVSHTRMSELWEKAKQRDLQGLDDEKQRLVKIMVDHEDELFRQFEHADLTYDPDSNSDGDYDPMLHVSIHLIAETQLDQNDPLEAVDFFTAMRRQKYSRHEAVHLIGQILGYFIFDVLENQQPFDLETYRKLLAKYKSREPKKLMEQLEDEPLLSEAD
jgi:hypothetical protein